VQRWLSALSEPSLGRDSNLQQSAKATKKKRVANVALGTVERQRDSVREREGGCGPHWYCRREALIEVAFVPTSPFPPASGRI